MRILPRSDVGSRQKTLKRFLVDPPTRGSEERERVGEDEVVAERRTAEEQEHRAGGERRHHLALGLVQARRHKAPDLPGDDRRGQDEAGDEADLHVDGHALKR